MQLAANRTTGNQPIEEMRLLIDTHESLVMLIDHRFLIVIFDIIKMIGGVRVKLYD